MYNRYVPQPDGSYRRSRIPDPHADAPMPPPQAAAPPKDPPGNESCDPDHRENSAEQTVHRSTHTRQRRSYRQTPPPNKQAYRREEPDNGVGSFLRQLLPKDFETEDLLIILLLLLMAGNKQESDNTALLTLALYLFM